MAIQAAATAIRPYAEPAEPQRHAYRGIKPPRHSSAISRRSTRHLRHADGSESSQSNRSPPSRRRHWRHTLRFSTTPLRRPARIQARLAARGSRHWPAPAAVRSKPSRALNRRWPLPSASATSRAEVASMIAAHYQHRSAGVPAEQPGPAAGRARAADRGRLRSSCQHQRAGGRGDNQAAIGSSALARQVPSGSRDRRPPTSRRQHQAAGRR